MSRFTISFPDSRFAPLEVEPGEPLIQVLKPSNSPMMFGCKTGLCGTCLCTITPETACGTPDRNEREVLEAFDADFPGARLACRLVVDQDITMSPLDL